MPNTPHTRLTFIASQVSEQNFTSVPSRPLLCKRTQAGHTNRWQLAGSLGSDLLGQAQVQRAEKSAIKSSHRKIKSADPVTLHWHKDATSCTGSPLPRLDQPLSASIHTRLCKDVTWPSKLISPEEQFTILTRRVVHNAIPDAVLECLGSKWKLHCPFLSRSDTLFKQYTISRTQRDVQLQETAVSSKVSGVGSPFENRSSPAHRRRNFNKPLTLHLPVKDPSITKTCLSFALQTLYAPEERPDEWGEGVLSAAALLGISQLSQRCLEEMMTNISSSTVCSFHQVSCKIRETALQRACERWLELFLVTELSCHIKLKDLTFDLLLKTLRCPRLFTSCEYELLKAVLYWIYLQLNPLRQTLPAHSTIINYFSREAGVFLEQPQGQKYIAIFQALRLHGITEWQHLQEMQQISVFPESWLLQILSDHYRTMFSGGDMAVTDFSKQAVRFGMILNRQGQECCTQVISLYGFYFLLKANTSAELDAYSFSIERLRHWDTAQCFIETHPFCMRSDRLVCYQITAHSYTNREWREYSSEPVHQKFGLSKLRCRSKSFQIEGLSLPVLVTFALAFPSC